MLFCGGSLGGRRQREGKTDGADNSGKCKEDRSPALYLSCSARKQASRRVVAARGAVRVHRGAAPEATGREQPRNSQSEPDSGGENSGGRNRRAKTASVAEPSNIRARLTRGDVDEGVGVDCGVKLMCKSEE
jgi:hypothetical protein